MISMSELPPNHPSNFLEELPDFEEFSDDEDDNISLNM